MWEGDLLGRGRAEPFQGLERFYMMAIGNIMQLYTFVKTFQGIEKFYMMITGKIMQLYTFVKTH